MSPDDALHAVQVYLDRDDSDGLRAACSALRAAIRSRLREPEWSAYPDATSYYRRWVLGHT